MQTVEGLAVFGVRDAAPGVVIHLGAPSPEMARALDLAGIKAERADDVREVTAITPGLPHSTLLVPLPRWAEVAHNPRVERAVLVADADDYGYALVALDQGADDIVSPDDDPDSLRAILCPAQARTDFGDGSLMHAPRLAQLSAEVAKIALALEGLAHAEPEPTTRNAPVLDLTAPQVRALIRARRERSKYFPVDLFADPAWDILLDLMASRLEGRQVSVSSLCIAAAVPATTALRWIKSMTDADLLRRKPDPVDGRRVFIDLSHRAVEAMNAYLVGARGVVAV